jgi:hypothetical protein
MLLLAMILVPFFLVVLDACDDLHRVAASRFCFSGLTMQRYINYLTCASVSENNFAQNTENSIS